MSIFDSDGFHPKSLSTIISDMSARAKAAFGDGVRTDDDSTLYHLFATIGMGVRELHELGQGLYDGTTPNNAEGVPLGNVAAVSGLTRRPATKSHSDNATAVEVTGTQGTVIAAGKLVGMSTNPAASFKVLASVTIPVGGVTYIEIEAEEAGEIEVPTGDLDLIITAVAGWDTVENLEDLVPGTNREGDDALRLRRELSLQVIGTTTDGALRGALLAIASVTSATVTSNRTNAVDANGIPSKAFRCVVSPASADEAAVIAAIGSNMPAGIEPDGTESGVWVDPEDKAQVVEWSWATTVPVWVIATVVPNTSFPADGKTQVARAILAVFDGLAPETVVTEQDEALLKKVGTGLAAGDNVRVLGILGAIDTVPGVESLTLTLGTAPAPVGVVDIPITIDEIATSVAANISVP